MIDPAKRKEIWQFHRDGISIRNLAKREGFDRKTIKEILKLQGEVPEKSRNDKIAVDEDLVIEVFKRCSGWAERVHEILTQEYGKKIGYSTLTALIRELGLRNKKGKERSHSEPDVPGKEFQHDTSPIWIKVGERPIKFQASLLYFRYSKITYLKFYVTFTKFQMRCFFYEALTYFEYAAESCIIDNTSVVIHHGTGSNAVPHADMEELAHKYGGFKWHAHAVRHSDRKGGVEKGIHTIISNFLAGRTFTSLEDMNKQAFDWCIKRSEKPLTKAKIIPRVAFEFEKTFLKRVQLPLFKPYLIHDRVIDEYGFIAFKANYYWIPKGTSDSLKILEYSDSIVIYSQRKEIIKYILPPFGTRNEKITPKGTKLEYCPKSNTANVNAEEKKLRSIGDTCNQYISLAIKDLASSNKGYQFIRGLYSLYKHTTTDLFNKTIERASAYRVYNIQTLNKITGIIINAESDCEKQLEYNYNLAEPESFPEDEYSEPAEIYPYNNEDKNEKP